MTDRFKAPDPMPMERYDLYFLRMVEAFEEWANTRVDQALARIENTRSYWTSNV